tara:strand:- start:543 stop:2135 length:1593 start_codon:yes stop_codon:yes gene_type:complete
MNSIRKNNIFSVSLGTILSKIAGFIRQILIAALFGIGFIYDSYNYAYIIPGFLIVIIGGINGPLHNSIVTVLTPLNDNKTSLILKNVGTKVILIFLFIGLIVFLNSNLLISILAPKLDNESQLIAANQLKILSPCIPLSAFNGISFGILNSKNKFFLSSISPAIVSLTTIIFIIFYWIFNIKNKIFDGFLYIELIALATLVGTVIQFLVHFYATFNTGLLRTKFSSLNTVKEEKRIFNIIIPSSLASGLGQINVYVDMFFASSFKGAASGLTYSNFLIQAPLGLLSNILILPILPKFSNLINKNEIDKLGKELNSTIEYCLLTTFLLTGLFISFNEKIIDILFQRGAFDYDAGLKVGKILIAYSIGVPVYLLRDLLIRTYYSLELTKLPFNLSIVGIGLNIFFDWILVGAPINNYKNLSPFNFGIVGLVLASGLVNLIICTILKKRLNAHIRNLVNFNLFKKLILIIISCIITSFISYQAFSYYENINNQFFQILIFLTSVIIYCIIYFLITKFLKVNNYHLRLAKNINF